MPQELQFWLWLFLLNCILFLPRFLMEWKETAFVPLAGLLKGSAFERFRFLSYRYNYDLFRACFDFFLVCFLLYWFRDSIHLQVLAIPFFIFYLLLLLHFIYFNLFDKVFNLPPLFYNDFYLLWHGLKIAFVGFFFWTLLAIVGVLGIGYGLFYGLTQLLNQLMVIDLGIWSYAIFVGVFAMGWFSSRRYSYEQMPQQLIQSPLRSIFQNIKASFRARKNLGRLKIDRLEEHNIYRDFELPQRPNIYFLVVESYGRILLDDESFAADYKEWMQSHQTNLQKNNWAMTTALSTPPIVGGASWLSYSSILFGFRIDNQGTYLALSNSPDIPKYHSFFRFLQTKSYKNYQLNSLGGFDKMKIPWETYSRYYSVDEWIIYKDLNYNGPLYGFGPSPPDQYALNFAANRIREKAEEPFTLFYITQNSHSPFESPKTVAEDWQTLNTGVENIPQASKFFEKPTKKDYKEAMKYQMDFLMDFVQKQGGENDLFIIIGDHQPPVLTPRESPQETPVHIIAHQKHKAFIDHFKTNGFVPGLLADPNKPNLKHEGLYSLWMRHFLQYFSKVDPSKLPPYFPDGLDFSKKINR